MYRYKQPFRDGSTHVVLEPLDFMFRMNGMPRAHDCRDAGGRATQEHRLLDFRPSSPAGDPPIVVTEVVRNTFGLAMARSIHPCQPTILAGFRQHVVYSPYPPRDAPWMLTQAAALEIGDLVVGEMMGAYTLAEA